MSFILGIILASALPPKNPPTPNETESPEAKRKFSGSYLGFVIMAVLLAFGLILAFLTPHFFSNEILAFIAESLAVFGLPAIAIALTTRAKGPDLSLGAVTVFSGVIAALVFTSGGSVADSVVAALLAAALAGAITGALTVTLRLPSMLASIAVSIALSIAATVIAHGERIIVKEFSEPMQTALLPGAEAILPVVIVAAFLFVYFTRLGKPINDRAPEENRSLIHFSTYIVGAVLAGIAAVYGLSWSGVANPADSGVPSNFMLFIFGAILSSKLLDNRWAPVLFAFGAAFLYEIISIAMLFGDVYTGYQTFLLTLIALAITAVGAFANRKAIANMLAFKQGAKSLRHSEEHSDEGHF
jgi:ribose transport system permease protein